MIDLVIEAGSGSMKSLISITLIAAAGLLLSACESIETIPASEALVDGAAIAAPPGWVDYCSRHVEDSGCR
jgi:predicted transglutaminase-like cysteine proteinase